ANEEIKSAVWDCGTNKSPCLDGVTFEFFRRYWKLLEHDIVAAVKEFFASGLFSGIPIDSSLTLSRLFFVDDAIFIVKVGGAMSKVKSWDDVVAKVSSRLSKFPSGVLKLLESIRRNFFNEVDGSERKMAWISWNKVLASKKYSGLDVSSFIALNRALLFKWVWRFFFHGSFLWTRFIKAIYGEDGALNSSSSLSKRSLWLNIIREVTEDPWLDDLALKHKFPRLYALDNYKKINHASMVDTFRRPPRGGDEEEQLGFLLSRMDGLILTNTPDR
ncbi:hypothetical protein Tco_1388475, partial [Tanacetum coccineum]